MVLTEKERKEIEASTPGFTERIEGTIEDVSIGNGLLKLVVNGTGVYIENGYVDERTGLWNIERPLKSPFLSKLSKYMLKDRKVIYDHTSDSPAEYRGRTSLEFLDLVLKGVVYD